MTGRSKTSLGSYTIDQKRPSRFQINDNKTLNFGFMKTEQSIETLQDTVLPPLKKKGKLQRFIMSKETIKEFGLKQSDIPQNMRKETSKFRDHVQQNINI